MADLLFIALMIVFFALAVVLVRACDRIIGRRRRRDHRHCRVHGRRRGDRGVSYDNGVALVLSILVTAYLIYALIAPEKL